MRKTSAALLVLSTGLLAAALALMTSPVQATTTPTGPSFTTCANLVGWYANPDEQANLPEPTAAGLMFEGKDLIHHAIATPIDFADMDKVAYSFTATVAGKVVFKVETSSPYSTIITNADGKLWSTAMTYDQEGGQGHPVAKYTDLLGKPTKPGKAEFSAASRVVTFGVGYWTEEGSTVVSSISFHGTGYPLTCVPPTTHPTTHPTHRPTPRPTCTRTAQAFGGIHLPACPTTAPTTVPPTTRPTTAPPTTRSPEPTVPPTPADPSNDPTPPVIGRGGPSLPVTGPSGGGWFIGGGLGLIVVGIGLFLVARRRRKLDLTA